jgi:uncharacterized membrane protein YfhO
MNIAELKKNELVVVGGGINSSNLIAAGTALGGFAVIWVLFGKPKNLIGKNRTHCFDILCLGTCNIVSALIGACFGMYLDLKQAQNNYQTENKTYTDNKFNDINPFRES